MDAGPTAGASLSAARPRIALVMWTGAVGGAERLTLALAAWCRRTGEAEATVLALTGELPPTVVAELARAGVRHETLGLARGSRLSLRPRRFVRLVQRAGPDGVLLPSCGSRAAVLRAAGYRSRIVATEHGGEQFFERPSGWRRLTWFARRASGAVADSTEVAVSDFVLSEMRRRPVRARRLARIYNGVDLDAFRPGAGAVNGDGGAGPLVVGAAARLIPGKGMDVLIEAFACLDERYRATLRIAGEGPERERLAALVASRGLAGRVELSGAVDDMPGFWSGCDVVAIPSSEFVEACPMVALEALAGAKAIVATSVGGLPELVEDGETGIVVEPGDVEALAGALSAYAEDPGLRAAHGRAARRRAEERFSLDTCARRYLALLASDESKPTKDSRWHEKRPPAGVSR